MTLEPIIDIMTPIKNFVSINVSGNKDFLKSFNEICKIHEEIIPKITITKLEIRQKEKCLCKDDKPERRKISILIKLLYVLTELTKGTIYVPLVSTQDSLF